MNKFIMNLPPTIEDWGVLSKDNDDDWDAIKAFEDYSGKTNEEIQHFLSSHDLQMFFYTGHLRFMPEKPFLYYIYSLKIFIESEYKPQYDESYIGDAISVLIGILDIKSVENPDQIEKLYIDFFPFLKKVAAKQDYYDMPEEIYGSFNDRVNIIFERFPNLIY